MSKVLVLKATPRDERSRSMAVARTFLEAYSAANPGDKVTWLDAFAEDIPEFDALAAEGKYRVMRMQEHEGAEAERWQRVVEVAEHFKSFDKYVIVAPMWNFSVPYRLKLYIDTILQPSLTFGYDPDKGGYFGLVGDKPTLVVSARGGSYTEEEGTAAIDFHLPYLLHVLGMMGIVNVESILIQPCDMMGPDVAAEKVAAAKTQAEALATTF